MLQPGDLHAEPPCSAPLFASFRALLGGNSYSPRWQLTRLRPQDEKEGRHGADLAGGGQVNDDDDDEQPAALFFSGVGRF